jgi:hypothetical protein
VRPSKNDPKIAPGSFRRLRLLLRVRAAAPSPIMPDRTAPPGVSRPFSDISGGIVRTGRSRARRRPSSGFLAPSTVCSPSGLADTLGPLPLLGFSPVRLFRTGRPWRAAAFASPHPLRPFVPGALQPRTLRNTRSKAPRSRRRLSPSALVPRTWFQSLVAPFEAHHLRADTGTFAPVFPSHA